MSDKATSNYMFKVASLRCCFLVVGIIAVVSFYFLAWAYPTFPGDEATLIRFQSFRTEWLDETAAVFADWGLIWVVLPGFVGLAVSLFLTRQYADVSLLLGGLVVVGMGRILKLLVERPRPDYQIIEPFASGFSFPSGHSLLAVVLGGVLVYWVDQWVTPKFLRRGIQAIVLLLIAAMGASRVYLGVHWPSDVLGSYLFGVLALTGLLWLRNNMAGILGFVADQ